MRPATIWSNCWLFSSVVMTGLGGHGPDPPWFTVSSSVVSRTMSS
ncbi:hypothetical protein [Cellulomonas cellasea]|nr:hypothetical protein [Cellulomonas cellasea]